MSKLSTIYHQEFIHQAFSHFYEDVLSYFKDHLYTRFEWSVISQYHKAVEYINKKEELGREADKPNLPAVVLDPSGEINIEEKMGKALYRFPNQMPGLGSHLWSDIYNDGNVRITPVFSRFSGSIEMIFLLDSFYEYLDLRVLLLQIFGGLDRIIYPQYFNSFIILDNEITDYEYENDATGEKYVLDWSNTDLITNQLVRTTNQRHAVYPFVSRPFLKLTGLSDGSTKYGGTDSLASWILRGDIEFEVEIPTYLILQSNFQMRGLTMNINFGSAYSEYDIETVPTEIIKMKSEWQTVNDSTAEIIYSESLNFVARFFHVVTSAEADSDTDVTFDLPHETLDSDLLILSSYNGIFRLGADYEISDDGLQMTIKVDNVELTTGDILELYYYSY